VPAPHRRHRLGAALASLLILVGAPGGARAAEVLELRLEGLAIPIRLDQLEAWSRRHDRSGAASREGAELRIWLDLLAPASRRALAELLQAPLLRDRSFGRQLLDSWAGGPMLEEVGSLLTTARGESTTPLIRITLRRLLEQRREVTALELLQAMPEPRLSLQLDRLIALASRWRGQLERQRVALLQLRRLALPLQPSGGPVSPAAIPMAAMDQGGGDPLPYRRRWLAVPHRPAPLPVDLWTPPSVSAAASRPWVLMMPGLGGDAAHLGWLAAQLAARGWSVAVLQHPGSDAAALRSALEGLRPPPGAETLATRLADAEAVLRAQRRGELPIAGDGVVLMGHSLGAVTALLAAGLEMEPGLDARCHRREAPRLPFTNPSRLLQCQLPAERLPPAPARPEGLRGVVLLNGFGSLYWPRRGLQPLPVPVLMIGGSLDLVTPPLEEQLRLFLPRNDGRSRLVVVDGGSHFSPVRMSDPEEALFRLGDELVGVNPHSVQDLLVDLTTEFLGRVDEPTPLAPQRRFRRQVSAYVLDPDLARRWSRSLPR
jgi:predicted dienelactone hydrolase